MSYMSGRRSESSASRRSLEEGEERDESKRRSRNLSEKKRRDQFNLLITELSTMLTASPRKMDKSTVLKGTIGFLKAHNEVTTKSELENILEKWKPSFMSNEEFTFLTLEALDGFLMVLSSRGKILHVSQNVTSLLGHLPSEIVGSGIYDLVQGDDKGSLQTLLNKEQPNAEEEVQGQRSSESSFINSILINIRSGGLSEGGGGGSGNYELVRLTGYKKPWIPQECGEYEGEEEKEDGVDPAEGDEEEGPESVPSRTVFVLTGRLVQSHFHRDMSVVMDSTKTEFSSRHSLEWKFLFLDHRAPPIIGYLPFEVLGTSGYDYYHMDDLEKVAACHERLMELGEVTSGYYRFLTKGQQWIWLQTRYYITYHQWNSKAEFIVGTHSVVRLGEVMKEFQPGISHESPSKVSMLDSFLQKTGEREGGGRKDSSPIGVHSRPGDLEELRSGFLSSFSAHPPLLGESRVPEERMRRSYARGDLDATHFHPNYPPPPPTPFLSPPGGVGEEGGGGVILQETLLFKHAQLQRRILEQQKELHEVSQRLHLTQCEVSEGGEGAEGSEVRR